MPTLHAVKSNRLALESQYSEEVRLTHYMGTCKLSAVGCDYGIIPTWLSRTCQSAFELQSESCMHNQGCIVKYGYNLGAGGCDYGTVLHCTTCTVITPPTCTQIVSTHCRALLIMHACVYYFELYTSHASTIRNA